jgi:hypothetical protein
MGEMMEENKKLKVFNSPLEIALRILLILQMGDKKTMSLDRLIIYDYLILNSGDIPNAPQSLHPSLPNRSSQLLIKRELIQKALLILASKELIIVKYTKQGIHYKSSKLAQPFISYFETPYFDKLKDRIQWVLANFNRKTDKGLDKIVSANLDKWGSEFTNESYMREEVYYE